MPSPETNEYDRYVRQMSLSDFGIEGQQKLRNSRVLIVGVGGLGCNCALLLSLAGIGTIGLIDHDTVDLTNIHRQILHSEETIGENKVESALKELRPKCKTSYVQFIPYTDKITQNMNMDEMHDLFGQYTVICDCTDSVDVRFIFGDFCAKYHIPYVAADTVGWNAHCTLYSYHDGPCLRCVHPTPPKPENVQRAVDIGASGPVVSIVNSVQSLETIKTILEKIKCDGQVPCKQCTDKSLNCTYQLPVKRRGPQKQAGKVDPSIVANITSSFQSLLQSGSDRDLIAVSSIIASILSADTELPQPIRPPEPQSESRRKNLLFLRQTFSVHFLFKLPVLHIGFNKLLYLEIFRVFINPTLNVYSETFPVFKHFPFNVAQVVQLNKLNHDQNFFATPSTESISFSPYELFTIFYLNALQMQFYAVVAFAARLLGHNCTAVMCIESASMIASCLSNIISQMPTLDTFHNHVFSSIPSKETLLCTLSHLHYDQNSKSIVTICPESDHGQENHTCNVSGGKQLCRCGCLANKCCMSFSSVTIPNEVKPTFNLFVQTASMNTAVLNTITLSPQQVIEYAFQLEYVRGLYLLFRYSESSSSRRKDELLGTLRNFCRKSTFEETFFSPLSPFHTILEHPPNKQDQRDGHLPQTPLQMIGSMLRANVPSVSTGDVERMAENDQRLAHTQPPSELAPLDSYSATEQIKQNMLPPFRAMLNKNPALQPRLPPFSFLGVIVKFLSDHTLAYSDAILTPSSGHPLNQQPPSKAQYAKTFNSSHTSLVQFSTFVSKLRCAICTPNQSVSVHPFFEHNHLANSIRLPSHRSSPIKDLHIFPQILDALFFADEVQRENVALMAALQTDMNSYSADINMLQEKEEEEHIDQPSNVFTTAVPSPTYPNFVAQSESLADHFQSLSLHPHLGVGHRIQAGLRSLISSLLSLLPPSFSLNNPFCHNTYTSFDFKSIRITHAGLARLMKRISQFESLIVSLGVKRRSYVAFLEPTQPEEEKPVPGSGRSASLSFHSAINHEIVLEPTSIPTNTSLYIDQTIVPSQSAQCSISLFKDWTPLPTSREKTVKREEDAVVPEIDSETMLVDEPNPDTDDVSSPNSAPSSNSLHQPNSDSPKTSHNQFGTFHCPCGVIADDPDIDPSLLIRPQNPFIYSPNADRTHTPYSINHSHPSLSENTAKNAQQNGPHVCIDTFEAEFWKSPYRNEEELVKSILRSAKQPFSEESLTLAASAIAVESLTRTKSLSRDFSPFIHSLKLPGPVANTLPTLTSEYTHAHPDTTNRTFPETLSVLAAFTAFVLAGSDKWCESLLFAIESVRITTSIFQPYNVYGFTEIPFNHRMLFMPCLIFMHILSPKLDLKKVSEDYKIPPSLLRQSYTSFFVLVQILHYFTTGHPSLTKLFQSCIEFLVALILHNSQRRSNAVRPPHDPLDTNSTPPQPAPKQAKNAVVEKDLFKIAIADTFAILDGEEKTEKKSDEVCVRDASTGVVCCCSSGKECCRCYSLPNAEFLNLPTFLTMSFMKTVRFYLLHSSHMSIKEYTYLQEILSPNVQTIDEASIPATLHKLHKKRIKMKNPPRPRTSLPAAGHVGGVPIPGPNGEQAKGCNCGGEAKNEGESTMMEQPYDAQSDDEESCYCFHPTTLTIEEKGLEERAIRMAEARRLKWRESRRKGKEEKNDSDSYDDVQHRTSQRMKRTRPSMSSRSNPSKQKMMAVPGKDGQPVPAFAPLPPLHTSFTPQPAPITHPIQPLVRHPPTHQNTLPLKGMDFLNRPQNMSVQKGPSPLPLPLGPQPPHFNLPYPISLPQTQPSPPQPNLTIPHSPPTFLPGQNSTFTSFLSNPSSPDLPFHTPFLSPSLLYRNLSDTTSPPPAFAHFSGQESSIDSLFFQPLSFHDTLHDRDYFYSDDSSPTTNSPHLDEWLSTRIVPDFLNSPQV
ncbi:putative Adenylyltransferase and sulfurtransferase MOCS3-2 [Blattamonas nauphoetae]|uniref:Adenylyltransferase and sulfurtransferase MOCS3-2 n=1 Tax=Blattamonas nauphoetae TaxID=2049346 RepID=A0ABQ9XH64_9EUKA|nr:putative Adenylyltransferase and sulfurtransferase MOCS3-2 [Blattamonas nauphoetae]